jgi:hypothetical protein
MKPASRNCYRVKNPVANPASNPVEFPVKIALVMSKLRDAMNERVQK